MVAVATGVAAVRSNPTRRLRYAAVTSRCEPWYSGRVALHRQPLRRRANQGGAKSVGLQGGANRRGDHGVAPLAGTCRGMWGFGAFRCHFLACSQRQAHRQLLTWERRTAGSEPGLPMRSGRWSAQTPPPLRVGAQARSGLDRWWAVAWRQSLPATGWRWRQT